MDLGAVMVAVQLPEQSRFSRSLTRARGNPTDIVVLVSGGPQPNERCCSQRHVGTLCNCAGLRPAPFTANLFEPLQQNAALGGSEHFCNSMKISFCLRRAQKTIRIAWFNESSQGIYLGLMGLPQEVHLSYHTDGTRHRKVDDKYEQRFLDAPISEHTGIKQLQHISMPISDAWLSSIDAYPGDKSSELIHILDEALLSGMDTLALDLYLFDRPSERDLLAMLDRVSRSDKEFRVASEDIISLNNFPQQKIAILLRTAKIRS